MQWRHNERGGVSNHQPHDCLLNRLFMRRLKETSKHEVPLAFMRGIHQSSVNSPHKGPVTRKKFPFDDVIMVPREYRGHREGYDIYVDWPKFSIPVPRIIHVPPSVLTRPRRIYQGKLRHICFRGRRYPILVADDLPERPFARYPLLSPVLQGRQCHGVVLEMPWHCNDITWCFRNFWNKAKFIYLDNFSRRPLSWTPFNPLAHGRYRSYFKSIFLNLIIRNSGWGSPRNCSEVIPQVPTDKKSTLVQVMACCLKATNHHIRPKFNTTKVITRYVCTLHYLIIIIMRTYLKVLNF